MLDGCSLEVGEGELCMLVGDNGAGKSTLVRLVLGELAPTGGSVLLMQRALLAGAALAVALPLIGVTLVLRRTSMTGDALAHCSLAGVAGGLVAGIDPVVGALVACIIASLSMEGMRRRMPRSADLTIAVVSAVGAGLAGVLSSFAGNTRSLDDYLFGSIVAVSADELRSVLVLSCGVVAFWVIARRALFSISVDESMSLSSRGSTA